MEENRKQEAPRKPRGEVDEVAVLRERLNQLETMYMSQARPPGYDDPIPMYRVTGPGSFFSRDCVLYPPGAIIKDKTQRMALNQELEPLNGAAKERMSSYLATLPDGGVLTPWERDELISQAQLELRDDREKYATKRQFNIACMRRAIEIKAERDGFLDPNDVLPKFPQAPDPNTPMMANVRISNNTGTDFSGASRMFTGGARRSAFPAGSETELVREGTVPANKTAPVFGNVQSQPLGTVGVE